MKHAFVKGISLSFILSFIFACNSKKEESTAPVVDKEQIKKEIQAKEDEFADTFNGGVLKSIGYYADDATSFYQNRAPLIGKDSIIAFLKSDAVSNSNKISFKTNEVFVSNDGNQVVEIGYFKVLDSANATINSGNYMSLFEKRDGKYVSLRDMSASDIPVR
ncbi:MAG TPA: nuclear transport factor 2 family protein [Puia sp.]|nr:nuclear transport factor 2 family protein [Puia sp.]